MTAEQVTCDSAPISGPGAALAEGSENGNAAPAARVTIVVDDKRKERFAPLAALPAVGSAGPCGPVMLVVLVIIFLLTTLGTSGAAGVFLSKILGLENEVDRLEAENTEYERLNQEYGEQLTTLRTENEEFADNNADYEGQLTEQKEINKNLTAAYEQLQGEVDKLEVVSTHLNETAIENNRKFEELLDELSQAINSSRAQHDKQLASHYNEIVDRVDCTITSIFTPFNFFQTGGPMAQAYPDVLKETNKVLADVCHDPADLEAWLARDSPARIQHNDASEPQHEPVPGRDFSLRQRHDILVLHYQRRSVVPV
jgi:hypothetical protein